MLGQRDTLDLENAGISRQPNLAINYINCTLLRDHSLLSSLNLMFNLMLFIFSCRYDYYSFSVIPSMGELVAGDRESYQYLVESIRRFPSQVIILPYWLLSIFVLLLGLKREVLGGLAFANGPIVASQDAQIQFMVTLSSVLGKNVNQIFSDKDES